MKFLKNRLVAVILLAVVVCTSTVNSAKDDLEDKADDVVDEFYYSYSGTKSIYEYLEARTDAASGLTSIAERYNLVAETETLKFSNGVMQDLIDHNYYDNDAMEDFYHANEDLDSDFDVLYHKLIEEDLSDSDLKAVEAYHTTFLGAQKMINQSDYNDKVRQFHNEVYSRFPAHLFMDLFDIDDPEFYASDGDHYPVPEAPTDQPGVTDLETAAENFGESLGTFISETVESSIEGALEGVN